MDSKTLAVQNDEKGLTLTMSRATGVAIALGLAQLAEQGALTRAQRKFFGMASALIDDAVVNSGDGADIPLDGRALILERYTPEQLELPREPTLFTGEWVFRNKEFMVKHLAREKERATSPTVWDFVKKCDARELPLPAGATDWLLSAPMDSEAVFKTTKWDVTFFVTPGVG